MTDESRELAPILWQGLFAYGISLIDGGNVVVCGGWNGDICFSDCMIYTTSENEWSFTVDLPFPLAGFAMLTLNKLLFVFGGGTEEKRYNTVYRVRQNYR